MKKKRTGKRNIRLLFIIMVGFVFNLAGVVGNTKMIFAEVKNDYRPIGNVTSISVQYQTLYLAGYAFDNDCLQHVESIHVYIYQDSSDKIYIGGFTADSYNPLDNKEYNCGNYHGFDNEITVDKTGTWNLEVYAIDLNSDGSIAGVYNPIIYSGTVTFSKELSLDVSTNTLNASSDGTLSQSYIKIDTNGTGTCNVYSNKTWLKVGIKDDKSSSKNHIKSIEDGYIYVFVDENTNTTSRTGMIMIYHSSNSSCDNMVTVTQYGKEEAILSASQSEMTVQANGTVSPINSVKISTNNTGGFSVSSSDNWLKISKENSENSLMTNLTFTEDGYFYIFANENTTENTRNATITITHDRDSAKTKTITITQEGKAKIDIGSPYLSLSQSELNVAADGSFIGSNHCVYANTNNTGGFQVSSTVSWIKIDKNAVASTAAAKTLSYTDSGSFYLFVEENTLENSRTAIITITHTKDKNLSNTVIITQEASNVSSSSTNFSVSRDTINANVNGETDINYIEVKADNTDGFSVKTSSPWIHIAKTNDGNKTSNLSFDKNAKFYIFIDKTNDNGEREGNIMVTSNSGDISKVITVRQAELIPILSVSSNTISVEQDGNFSKDNEILINTENTGGFTAAIKGAEWLRLVSNKEVKFSDGFTTKIFDDSAVLYLAASENQTGSIRTGQIIIEHSSGRKVIIIDVSQSSAKLSAEGTFIVDTKTYDFEQSDKAASSAVNITADNMVNWTVTSNDSTWLKISKDKTNLHGSLSGSGSFVFYIVVEKNKTYEERGEWIMVTAPEHETYEIYVTQAANEPDIVSETVINQIKFSTTKKTFGIKKTSKIQIQYPNIPELGIEEIDVKNCVESIQYKSTKSKVVSVSKKGIIKGKKKGKGKVVIKITLSDDEGKRISREVTVNVKVGRAKVNIKKFQDR